MSLAQAVNFLKSGKVFTMYIGWKCRTFYKIDVDLKNEETVFCYLDCGTWPGLLNKGEWDDYLLKGDVIELLPGDPDFNRIASREVSVKREYNFTPPQTFPTF